MPIMRTPLQILFLILVTDLPPSVALGMEKSSKNILKESPRPKKQPIMLGWMWQGILVNAIILSCTTMAVYVWGLSFYLGEYSGSCFASSRVRELSEETYTVTHTLLYVQTSPTSSRRLRTRPTGRTC